MVQFLVLQCGRFLKTNPIWPPVLFTQTKTTEETPPFCCSNGDRDGELLGDDVEAVLVAEETPDDGDVLDEDVEGDGAESAKDAQHEAEGAKAI